MAVLRKLLIPTVASTSSSGSTLTINVPPRTIKDKNGNEIHTVKNGNNETLWKKFKAVELEANPDSTDWYKDSAVIKNFIDNCAYWFKLYAGLNDYTLTPDTTAAHWAAVGVKSRRDLIEVNTEHKTIIAPQSDLDSTLKAYYGEELQVYVSLRPGFYSIGAASSTSWGNNTNITISSSLTDTFCIDNTSIQGLVNDLHVCPKSGTLKLTTEAPTSTSADSQWNYTLDRRDSYNPDFYAPEYVSTGSNVYYKDEIELTASPKAAYATTLDYYYLPYPNMPYTFTLTRTDAGTTQNYFNYPNKIVPLTIKRSTPIYFETAPTWTAVNYTNYATQYNTSVINGPVGYRLTGGTLRLNPLAMPPDNPVWTNFPITFSCDGPGFKVGSQQITIDAQDSKIDMVNMTLNYLDLCRLTQRTFDTHPWSEYSYEQESVITASKSSDHYIGTALPTGELLTFIYVLKKPTTCCATYSHNNMLYKLDYVTGNAGPVLDSDFTVTVAGTPTLRVTRVLSNYNGTMVDWYTTIKMPQISISCGIGRTIDNNCVTIQTTGSIYNFDTESYEMRGATDTQHCTTKTNNLVEGITIDLENDAPRVAKIFDQSYDYDRAIDMSSCRYRELELKLSWKIDGVQFTKTLSWDDISTVGYTENS